MCLGAGVKADPPAHLTGTSILNGGTNMEELAVEDIRELAANIALERLAPHASEIDCSHNFPWDNIHTLARSDFLGLINSEEEGGLGFDRIGLVSVVKEIARACASTALIYVSHLIVAKAIETSGNVTVKGNWLPKMIKGKALGAFAVHEPDSGSNSGVITTQAKKEHDTYVLNGTKFFITSAGEAGIYLVLVRTDPKPGPKGMSTLLVEKDTPGFSFGRIEDKMGLRSTSSREIFFRDCQVPLHNIIGKEGEGTQVLGNTVIGWGFFGAAAISVGIAISATELAIRHARERSIAGQPIGVHQAVQSMITDMIIKTEAAESLLNTCAYGADLKPDTAVINGLKAKLFASENAVEITNKAIQVFGGHGFCRDFIVERLFRDARGLVLHFKTSEWLRQDIAKAALKL
jgi:alkylation response protein AidB-like acyl-CoA dehydrogenase